MKKWTKSSTGQVVIIPIKETKTLLKHQFSSLPNDDYMLSNTNI